MKANSKNTIQSFTGNLILSPIASRYLAENKVWLHASVDHQAGNDYRATDEIIVVLESAGDICWEEVIQVCLTYTDGQLIGWEVLV